MNAVPFPPPLEGQRALICSAFAALIDTQLAEKATPRTTQAAQSLLASLSHHQLAEVTSTHATLQMTMFGIRATGTSVTALLRQWQREVADRLAQGVRR